MSKRRKLAVVTSIVLAFGLQLGSAAQHIADNLPAKPTEKPLVWRPMADAFDAYIMNPANKVMFTRPDGRPYFASALEGRSDELMTFGPVALGKILRGDDVSRLLPSLAGYFNEDAGIFLNSTRGSSIECWYLMDVDALAAGIIRSKLADDPASLKRLRSTADRLIEMTHQIAYNFHEQGYNFATKSPWTKKDIYRQPDAVGGYAYLMLFAYEMFGERKYLDEAQTGLMRYQAFTKDPWYEIPSGAMACLAAARLSAHYNYAQADLHKTLSFALDPEFGALQTGDWGGKEVNGLMRGWGGGNRYDAYSMESMVALPYLLPVLRYNVQYATDIGRYALNVAANMRWFYSQHLPAELQGRPQLTPAVPYERFSRTVDGHTPYATGDFASQRSVYGGAYALWFGEIIRPTQDDYILQLSVAKTDFLAKESYPTYLYYNPWQNAREIVLELGHGKFDIYETVQHRELRRAAEGSVPLRIPPGGARVVVVVPSGKRRTIENGVLKLGGVAVDYQAKR